MQEKLKDRGLKQQNQKKESEFGVSSENLVCRLSEKRPPEVPVQELEKQVLEKAKKTETENDATYEEPNDDSIFGGSSPGISLGSSPGVSPGSSLGSSPGSSPDSSDVEASRQSPTCTEA